MKIVKEAVVGTLESSDLLVKIAPANDRQVHVIIHSEVIKQFGKQINLVVTDTLKKLNVSEGTIVIEDKGALDCVIRARVQAATLRGAGCDDLVWGQLA